jgi:hypothetical protein
MKTTTINCTTGIYDTYYTIRDYGSKIIITAPYVHWTGNSGTLDFGKTKITNPRGMALIREMVASDHLVSDGNNPWTIDEVIERF